MRRWIAIFFLVLFPLQAVWAAAAPYCQHESAPSSFHPGHHVHDHHTGDIGDSGDSGDTPTNSLLPGMDDGDCQSCHAFCSAVPVPLSPVHSAFNQPAPALGQLPALPAPPQSPPDRPNWHALA